MSQISDPVTVLSLMYSVFVGWDLKVGSLTFAYLSPGYAYIIFSKLESTGDFTDIYYYDGEAYHSIEPLLKAVKQDVDFCFSDADMDRYMRENGGVLVDGEEYTTCLSLKRHNLIAYRESRNEVIDMITSEVREGVEMGCFPIKVPFTDNLLECSE